MKTRIQHSAIVLAVAVTCLGGTVAHAQSTSAAPILQWFDGTYDTIEARTADLFMAGYGAVWLPPPGRADSGNQSVGYDVYDRFDLGSATSHTGYGTETGLKKIATTFDSAGIDLHIDAVVNHNGFSDASRPGFLDAGGYPGFLLRNPDGTPTGVPGTDGDFHSPFAGGDIQGRLAGLIDINHSTNFRYVRHPVPGIEPAPGDHGGNLPAGAYANIPTETNRRFYPDQQGSYITIDDPRTGEYGIRIYNYNSEDPMAGDPVGENATGYLMRYLQWMVQEIGVDGFRIDAAKHIDGTIFNYFDRAVFDANPRKLLDGSTRSVFSYSEVFDGNRDYLLRGVDQGNFLDDFYRKDAAFTPAGQVSGNRDLLDFAQHSALLNNLRYDAFDNNWHNVINAGLDAYDNGFKDGSAGVLFVNSHDQGGPDMGNVAHAYALMQPGNTVVYFRGGEFGTVQERDFPKAGRGDALGGVYGDTITKLVEIRNTHGRGDYYDRWVSKESYAFERLGSSLVLLSNRNDNYVDQQSVYVGFAPGTYLVELTGNAEWHGMPQVLEVFNDQKVNVSFLPNNGQDHGYLIYGLATPQSSAGLELSNISQVLAGGTPQATDYSNGTTRLTDIHVISADNFNVSLATLPVNLLGSIRDRNADGDNALLSIDGRYDANGNGYVDFTTPGTVAYGFERFQTVHQPGFSSPDGNGLYVQSIDATGLSEGYHYIEARAFRHRDDGGPAVYSSFKKVIYVDRLKPESAIDRFIPFGDSTGNNDLWVRSTDMTADSVHVFLNEPASTTDAQLLQRASNGEGQSQQLDRDIFKRYFDAMGNGNNVLTIVTYEITGNYNVQRIVGQQITNGRGAGLGDLNFDGLIDPGDMAFTGYGFESVLYSRNTTFNPAADFNGDGLVDMRDLLSLKTIANSAGSAVYDSYSDMLLRRGNMNQQFGTDQWDIDYLYTMLTSSPADPWWYDLNSDGLLDQNDVDVLVQNIFNTAYGDANLDGVVDRADLDILLGNYTLTTGWAGANFDGLPGVLLDDLHLLLDAYSGPRGTIPFYAQLGDVEWTLLRNNGFTVVPEPVILMHVVLATLLMGRRRKPCERIAL